MCNILFLLVLHDWYFMTHYLMYISSCHFIFPCLCITMQLLVSFLYLYHACAILTSLSHTMLGRPFVVVDLGLLLCYHLPCHYFRPVSFMLPFNTCILLGNWLLSSTTRLLSISYHDWLLVKYHHLIMLSLDTKHDAPDSDIIITITGM